MERLGSAAHRDTNLKILRLQRDQGTDATPSLPSKLRHPPYVLGSSIDWATYSMTRLRPLLAISNAVSNPELRTHVTSLLQVPFTCLFHWKDK
jgi:hypothetical protein